MFNERFPFFSRASRCIRRRAVQRPLDFRQRKPGFRLALFGTGLALGVIALGAFTRLVDAGLGCPDWPGCYGHALWPNEDHEIAAANAAYPDSPVEHDKTWPEMVHRYLAAGLGLLCIALAYACWRRRGAGQPWKLPLFLLAFVILQGAFGAWTVTLKLWPQVVTAHLLGGFATLCMLWLLVLRLSGGGALWSMGMVGTMRPTEPPMPQAPNEPQAPPISMGTLAPAGPPARIIAARFKLFAIAALLVTIAQIALGGWTTSNYAAVACPDLPTCQARWWPEMNFAEGFNVFQSIGPNYLGGLMTNEARVAIHIAHRLGALVTLLVVGGLCFTLRRAGAPPLKRLARIIAAILAAQFALGLANILFAFPLWIAIAHNLGAALLLLALTTLTHRLSAIGRAPEDVIRGLLNFRTEKPCDDISPDEVRQAMREGRVDFAVRR